MKEIGLSLAGLGLLYGTRRVMTRQLGQLVALAGKNQSHQERYRIFLIIWSTLFLPGTIIHELSHFFAAAATGARTGKIEIFPTLPDSSIGADDTPKSTHLGFVQTQRLGPIRGFLIGTAPLFAGFALMIWISSQLEIFNHPVQAISQLSPLNILLLYLFFTIANSLFPSWADVKQALPLIVLAALAGGIFWLLGGSVSLAPDARLLILLRSLWTALFWSAGLNVVIVGLLRIPALILLKIRRS